ncbi:3-dehydro-bile acid delta(4,6)-reductase [Eubacterium plexicaudatum ASF492]|uniref:HI0933 family flavoprotein n=1 Tax=Eubacterium plexicaudatum ASF492 TaxID=1235802 RepID=N2B9H4_9FIRM|nr:3-dehydro-bile acid delta(4,6)-reductase [Eubacterium plexicaudatum ASF492]
MAKKTIYDAVVIGAGASGLMAAVTAARLGAAVVLLEHMEQPAKKILATGNGKCNYTNADQNLENYYCEQPDFIRTVLAQFSYKDTIRFFNQLGIRPVEKNGTCMYPESEQASSVRNVLLAEVRRLQVPLFLSVGIRSIHKLQNNNGTKNRGRQVFEIQAKDETFYAHACILATGGMAAKKTGSDGSGYVYAKQLGHTIVKPLPALTALLVDAKNQKLPAGVRIPCAVSLYADGKQKALERGELQITDYGISGIVIFQFGRIASRALENGQRVSVCLDFKPDMETETLLSYLTERFGSIYQKQKNLADGLIGFLPDKLIPVLLKQAGLRTDEHCGNVNRKQIARLTGQIKQYDADVTGVKGFDAAQVTTGGVPVREICARRMESKKVPGLYFAGEIVDVDGKCGGYNLQWAWSSGYAAGKSIAECK